MNESGIIRFCEKLVLDNQPPIAGDRQWSTGKTDRLTACLAGPEVSRRALMRGTVAACLAPGAFILSKRLVIRSGWVLAADDI